MNSDLSSLNEPQRQAVLHRGGPLLLLAGAGSGKTRVVTHRIAHLVDEGVRPDNILAVTFTNKAATEMSERLDGLIGRETARQVMTSTFHKLGAVVLRHDGKHIGVQEGFSIIDSEDQLTMVRDAMRQADVNMDRYEPKWVLYRISMAKNAGLGPEDMGLRITDVIGQVISAVYQVYTTILRHSNAVDFDDLLFLPLRILRAHQSVLSHYRDRFHHILVDEFQDSNQVQLEIVRLLAQVRRNLCVVGDDDQSIYGWRGAVVRNILDFEKHFPDATVVTLSQNYRSTSAILSAANAVIRNNFGRRPKELWTDVVSTEAIPVIRLRSPQDEAQYVAEQIGSVRDREKRPWNDFAILLRTNAQTRHFEEALRLAEVPYHLVGGLTFWDRAEIKDAIALLRLLVNPGDELALRRAVGLYGSAIGPATFKRLADAAHVRRARLMDVLEQGASVAGVGGKAAQLCADFARQMRTHMALLRPGVPLAAMIRRFFDSFELRSLLIARSGSEDEGNRRYQNVRELVKNVEVYESRRGREATLDDFLRILMLDQGNRADDVHDKVTVMTLHSAKGLEFPVVFLCGVEERILPHGRVLDENGDIDEERRLFYVGVTRARERLILTWCQKRERFGETIRSIPSRFLDELPDSLVRKEDYGDSVENLENKGATSREQAFQKLAALFGERSR